MKYPKVLTAHEGYRVVIKEKITNPFKGSPDVTLEWASKDALGAVSWQDQGGGETVLWRIVKMLAMALEAERAKPALSQTTTEEPK